MENGADTWKCQSCGAVVDTAGLGFFAEVTCPGCGKTGHVHCKLADFHIENILGIGGMSVVMRAYDSTLGRPVAIKLLNETYKDEQERIRNFESECALMAKVRHENVVSVYSAGWARGQFYIAMELVEGENLELIIARRKFLLPEQAVDIIRQVALGLQAAHQAGLLHRDVKPGNVIITRKKKAKVLDFGLSMESRNQGDDNREQVIWATPFYVPPETLRREREDVRSDIYALGMTLRNLLTGVDTMPGEFSSVSGLLELKEHFPTMRETYPQLDEYLCDFVDHMAAFNPEDRPADYAEVIAELDEVREHLRKQNPRRTSREWMQKRRREMMVIGGAAVLGCVIAASSVGNHTVKNVQGYLETEVAVTCPEWQALAQAEEQMAAGKWVPAADGFQQIARGAAEPATGMRAAMLCGMLKALLNAPAQEVQQCFERMGHFAAQAADNPAAAPGNWREMEKVLRLVGENLPANPDALEDIDLPELRLAAAVLASHRAASEGFIKDAEALQADAAEVVAQTDSLAHFSGRVNSYKLELARVALAKLRERVVRQLGKGELEGAAEALDSLSAMQLTAAEQAEVEVQRDLCRMATAVFEALRKHGVDPVEALETPQIFREACSRFVDAPLFKDEMFCLACMLRGEYARAFAEDPYRADPQSRAPFAVLMRSWRERLLGRH